MLLYFEVKLHAVVYMLVSFATSWRQSLHFLYNFKQYTNIVKVVQLQL
jgi:hypothetical protein